MYIYVTVSFTPTKVVVSNGLIPPTVSNGAFCTACNNESLGDIFSSLNTSWSQFGGDHLVQFIVLSKSSIKKWIIIKIYSKLTPTDRNLNNRFDRTNENYLYNSASNQHVSDHPTNLTKRNDIEKATESFRVEILERIKICIWRIKKKNNNTSLSEKLPNW